MDYKRFYEYLESRPLTEIKDCMENVIEVFKRQNTKDLCSKKDVLPIDNTEQELYKLRVSQRVWTQQAVWSKFASTSGGGQPSIDQLAVATSHLLTDPTVAAFVVSVNKEIDGEVRGRQSVSSQNSRTHSIEADSTLSKHTLPSHRLISDRVSLTPAATTEVAESFSPEPESTGEQSTLQSDGEDTESSTSENSNFSQPTGKSTNTKKRKRGKRRDRSWTEQLDIKLLAAIAEHKDEGWPAIAKLVGHGMTRNKCYARWSNTLGPLQRGMKKGERWTADEKLQLGESVARNTVLDTRREDGTTHIRWSVVSEEMNRVPFDCRNEWTNACYKKMKKGTFTAAEDAQILHKEETWGNNLGLWAALERELNRPAPYIQQRWKTLSKRHRK